MLTLSSAFVKQHQDGACTFTMNGTFPGMQHTYESREGRCTTTPHTSVTAVLTCCTPPTPAALQTQYGAPATVAVVLHVAGSSADPAALQVSYDVQWFDKRPTRMAESLWLEFSPALVSGVDPTAQGWEMDKLGVWVNPYNVVVNGSQSYVALASEGAATRARLSVELSRVAWSACSVYLYRHGALDRGLARTQPLLSRHALLAAV